MPVFKGSTSRGTHVRAIAAALQSLIDGLPDFPSAKRVALRNHLAALKRAYPHELQTSETSLFWETEGEDEEF